MTDTLNEFDQRLEAFKIKNEGRDYIIYKKPENVYVSKNQKPERVYLPVGVFADNAVDTDALMKNLAAKGSIPIEGVFPNKDKDKLVDELVAKYEAISALVNAVRSETIKGSLEDLEKAKLDEVKNKLKQKNEKAK